MAGVLGGAVGIAAAAGGISAGSTAEPDAVSVPLPLTTISAITISHDTGTSASDFITRLAPQTVGATLSAALASGQTVWASVDSGVTWVDVTASVQGTELSWGEATLVAGGGLVFEVRNSTGAGPTATQDYVLDSGTAAAMLSLNSDSGSSSADHITRTGSLSVLGTEADATLQYSTDGGSTWTDSFTAVEGVNTVLVRSTDAAGNQATSAPFTFTLDTQTPAPTLALTTDSGTNAADHVSRTGTLSVGGIEAGATVAYSSDGGSTWTDSFTAVEGVNTVLVRSTDSAGNQATSSPFTFTLDSQTPAPTLALASDTGSSSSDKLTRTGTLSVSGAEAGATLEYSTDDGSTWTGIFTATSGVNTVMVRSTDSAGNQATSAPFTFTLDTQTSRPTLALTTDTGSGANDRNTRSGGLSVSGAEVGATLAYSTDGGTTWTPTFTASEGVNIVRVRSTDAAGNQATSAPFTFTLDTQTPAPTLALTSDTGSSATDHISRTGTVSASGAEAGASLQYSIDGGSTWTSTFTASEGANTVRVRSTDSAGNQATSAPLTFTLDTQTPSPTLVLTSDTGSSGSDHLTRTGTLSVGGAENGATLQYSIDGGSTWTNTFTASEGANTVRVRSTDVAGNQATSAALTFTLDTQTSAPTVALTSDTGSSASDRISQTGTLLVSGTESGAVVQYSIDGGSTWSGSFSAVQGVNNLRVRSTDAAGNQATTAYSFTLDTVAPGTPSGLTVPEAPSGVSDAEAASNGGVLVTVPLPAGVRAGFVITLTVDDPTNGAPFTLTHTLTQGEIDAGHGSVTIPTAQVGGSGTYSVTATVTDLAGNIGNSSGPATFVVLPALVMGEDCVILGFERRDYAPANLLESAATSNVFIVADGLDAASGAAFNEMAVYQHRYDVHTGSDLPNTSNTLETDAGGLHIQATGSLASRNMVIGGVAAAASANATAALATGGTDAIWVDSLRLSMDSTDDANGAVYVMANATGADSVAHFGAFAAGVEASAAGQAQATGMVLAHADGDRADATVELCSIEVEAEGTGNATATFKQSPASLGDIALPALTNAYGLVARAGAGAAASITIHEAARAAAASSGGTAHAEMGDVTAMSQGGTSPAEAMVSVGSIEVAAQSEVGAAQAVLGDLVANGQGTGSRATVEIDSDIVVTAQTAGASVAADASMGSLSADANGDAVLSRVSIGGDVMVSANAASGTASVDMDGLNASASGIVARADISIAGNFMLHASALYDAGVSMSSLQVSTDGVGATATIAIGGDLTLLAVSASGSAAASMDSWSASASGTSSTVRIAIGGDLKIEARGATAASVQASCTFAASAGDENALAEIIIGGSMLLNAVAVSGSADAGFSGFAATASGASAEARVQIGGNLSATANGSANASASIDALEARASDVGALASVTIGVFDSGDEDSGKMQAFARASAGTATAEIGPLKAQASAAGASASISIVNCVSASANGALGATAGLDTLIADASNGGTARVDIGTWVRASATASSGIASITLRGFEAVADGAGSMADLAIGSIGANATGAAGASIVVDTLANAVATNGGHAAITVLDSVSMHVSVSASGEALISLGALSALATGADSDASVHIYGGLSATMTASASATATVTLDTIQVKADGIGASASVQIDGLLSLSASASTGSAMAELGSIDVSASGSNARANLLMGSGLSVSAGAYATATARLGAISIAANGYASVAEMNIGTMGYEDAVSGAWVSGFGNVVAEMDGVALVAAGVGSEALLTVADGLTLGAWTTTTPEHFDANPVSYTADMGSWSVTASGQDSLAQVSIGEDTGGSLIVKAMMGRSDPSSPAQANAGAANATLGDVDVKAQGEGSTAQWSLGGSLVVHAEGLTQASGEINSLFAQAGEASGTTAKIEIGGAYDLLASALLGSADVSAGTVEAQASGTSGMAQISIGGNVSIEAVGEFSAEANFDGLSARADGEDSTALVQVGGDGAGDMLLAASAGAGSASAYFSSLNAVSSGLRADSELSIGGSVEVRATAAGAGNDAEVELAELEATAIGSESRAVINIGSDLLARADSANGPANAEQEGANIEASAESAFAAASIGGDARVLANGSSAAIADMDQWTVAALSDAARAEGQVDGNLSVQADADSAVARFSTDWGSMPPLTTHNRSGVAISAAAGAVSSSAASADASFEVGGDISIAATAIDQALADIGQVQVYGKGANSLAQVTIAGTVGVNATASDGSAWAQFGNSYSYVTANGAFADAPVRRDTALEASASSDGNVGIALLGGVSIHAAGSTGADAWMNDLKATAQGNGQADITVGGLSVTAVTTAGSNAGTATARLGTVLANNVSGVASVTLSDTLLVRAQSDTGAADAFGGIHSAIGTAASLNYQGVEVEANGGDGVLAQLGFFADSNADINVGDIAVTAFSEYTEADADLDLLFIAGAYDGASMALGALNVTLAAEEATGLVFLGADSSAVLDTGGSDGAGVGENAGSKTWSTTTVEDIQIGGPITLYAALDSSLTVWADHVARNNSSLVTVEGSGSLTLAVTGSQFAVIDASAFAGDFHYAQQIGSRDADNTSTTLSGFDTVAILGFDAADDTLDFGQATAQVGTWRDLADEGGEKRDLDGMNHELSAGLSSLFATLSMHTVDAGSFSTEAALLNALNSSLSGANSEVAYARFTGTTTLDGGVQTNDDDEHDWYAVAYDQDGTGITSLVFVQVIEGQTPLLGPV